jgi:hypothetical protein
MKKLVIEFTHKSGEKEEVEFVTDRSYDWTVQQWTRNRWVIDHKLISEESVNDKKMLLG